MGNPMRLDLGEKVPLEALGIISLYATVRDQFISSAVPGTGYSLYLASYHFTMGFLRGTLYSGLRDTLRISLEHPNGT